jgi:PAS domain S-box-containing protein
MKLHDLSLATRITIGVLAMVAAGTATLLFVESTRLRDTYLSEQHAHLKQDIETQTLRLNQTINTLRQDVLFLSNTPPVSGIVRATLNHGYDARDKNTRARWEQRLQQIFSAFSSTHPDYYKIRYIGVADGGRELVRIDNRGGKIEITPSDRLQAINDRDYFKASLGLRKGQVYLSEFNLNQDWGAIEQPHRPTLRAATPVFTPSGEIFGMVVINMNVDNLLKLAVSDLPGVQTFITNQDGQYLLHPDPGQAFQFDLGGKNKITTNFDFITSMFNPQMPDYLPLQVTAIKPGSPLFAAKQIHFDANNPSRFLLMMHYLPDTVVAGQVATIPANTLLYEFMAMLLTGGIATFVLRRTFSPLKQITAAADKIAAGNHDIQLPRTDGGEIGSLTSALNAMLTQLSQREKLLQESEAKYRRLHESMMDAFVMVDMSGRLLEFNHAYLEMLGYSADELQRQNCTSLTPEKWHEFEARIIEEQVIPHGHSQVYEKEYIRKDGTVFPVEFKAFLLRDANNLPEAMWAIVRDITERHEAKAALAKYKRGIENAIDGFWMTDALGNIQEANAAYAKISGYTVEELVTMHISQLEAIELAEDVHAHIEKIATHGHDRFETRHRHKDGHEIDIEVAVTYMPESSQLFVFCQDITERKHAEEELQKTQLNLLAAQQLAKIGSWEWDVRNNTATWSDETYRLFEIDKGELNEHRKNFLNLVTPEDRIKVNRALSDALDGVKKYDIEYRIRLADGRKKVIHALAETIRDAEGKAVAMRGTVQDITERKQAEELIQQFGSLLQGSFNEIYMFDADSLHFTLTSEGAEKNLGYTDDELNQLTPLDLKPSFTRKSFEQLIAPLRTGEQQLLHFEAVHRRKDGTTYPVEVRMQLMPTTTTTTFLAIVQDITERKQAMELLRKSSEEIADLYNRAPCGYHSLDKDGIIRQINDTELAWLGYTRDEVIGKMKWPDILATASLRTFREDFPRFMKRGFTRDFEIEILRKDGTTFIGLINASAIYDSSGDFVMSRSTVVDITARKEMERKLHDLNVHLQAVREEEKASIAREIHDDLGGTLTALKMETHWLKTERPANKEATPLLGHIREMEQLINNATNVMRRIITGLRPTILDDLGLLAALEWQAAQFHKSTGIACRVNCVCAEDEDCANELDKPRSIALFRIVQEALTNVARHSGASRVEIEFHRNDEEIVMSIIDNGRGMTKDRADASIPYGILGMTERVDQLDGTISFDTPPGGGFNVTVILPLPANKEGEKT